MQTYDAPTSVGSAVADAESDLLFGRDQEIAALRQLVGASRERPVVVYVHGPAGSGKSSSLRAVQRLAAGDARRTVLVDGHVAGHNADALLRWLQRALLTTPPPGGPRGADAVVEAINACGLEGGLLLAVDHYEELVAADGWLRHEILYRCGVGVCVMLAGRRSPDEAWPGDRAWRAVVHPVPLLPFGEGQAMAFLEHCGVHNEAARREAMRLAGTSPALLSVVADALTRLPSPAAGTAETAPDEVTRWSALIEQLLHPGSRRRAWRAGLGGSEVDRLLAAASLLPSFDREILAAMVGQANVDAGWPQVMGLRLLYPWQGRYRIHDTVRDAILAVVLRQRPWAQGRWRQRALTHALGRSYTPGGYEQEQALLLALHGSPLGTRLDGTGARLCARAASAGDCNEIAAAWRDGLAAEAPERTRSQAALVLGLLGAHPEAFRVVRDGAGRLSGYSASLPPSHSLAALLGPRAEQLPRQGEVANRLVLCVLHVCRSRPGVREALLRDLLLAFSRFDQVLSLLEDPEVRTVLTVLGFRDQGGAAVSEAQQFLDFAAFGGWPAWLRQLGRPQAEEAIPPFRRRDAARDALTALHDDDRLSLTAAARHYAAQYGQAPVPDRVRAWILDALASADLGGPSIPGRDVLHHYYVQRSGSHEAVAEELGASRATYFRWHRLALDRFGESLFS